MAKPAASISTEELPIDQACASGAATLWADYLTAKAAAGDLAQLRRMMPSALRADDERRLAAWDAARAALDAWIADPVERGEIELWVRAGNRIEDPGLIPPSAVHVLVFDYERRTASGEGLPLLYDVSVRQAPTASASAQWAADTIRRLRKKRKILEDVKKQSELALILEAESEKAVKAGQLRRALKASYLENELKNWGIWPLSSFK